MGYLEWEEEHTSKLDFYLAQIAAEVRRGYSTKPRKVKIKDFLLSFSGREQQSEGEARMKRSKSIWAAALGIKLKNN